MGSWLGARLRSYAGQSSLAVRLPRMQQRVFEDICRGLSNAEIAKHLKRSEYTVANHVKSLLKTFNVPSRSALVAEAVRRGLIKSEA
jgi:DNA-binding NarL/FixJ family response regulator